VAAQAAKSDVQVGPRTLSVSNLDKVLWPAAGFTKGQLIDYYARVAEVMVPHLQSRPITLRRWPDGVDKQSFFQKNCPPHRPDWMSAVKMGDVHYCLIDEPASLVWAANMAAIEIHPGLARAPELATPTSVVFDLDPGPPADVITCARVAMLVRDYLERLHLQAWPKTSGSKGLQLYVPLNADVDYDRTRDFAHALAQLLEREHADLVVSVMDPAQRKKKVMIDWSQNTASKTTVAVYSVRALDQPTVSTPITWDELEDALSSGQAAQLRFVADEVVQRLQRLGDLHAPVLTTSQELPALRI
jgi:bifunctional non-homologous end joining protein LigD